MKEQLKVLRRALSPDPASRYGAWHRILGRLVKMFHMRLYDLHVTWYSDPEFLAIWSGSLWNPEDTSAREYTLFSLLKSIRGIKGDTAECGVYEGSSSHLILSTLHDQKKPHHIFDSFEGLSAPQTEDCVNSNNVFKWKKHDLSVGEEYVRTNLNGFDNFTLHRGWIPDRFNEVDDRRFCFVHIDVDVYQPTLDAVEFFYPRLNQGGILVCDDYGFASCPGAKRAIDQFAEARDLSVIHLPTGQAVLIKR